MLTMNDEVVNGLSVHVLMKEGQCVLRHIDDTRADKKFLKRTQREEQWRKGGVFG
jgi:hypothetical protein